MAEKKREIMTPEFRVAFPSVFKPREQKRKTDEPRFEIVALFPKGCDLTELKLLAREAAEAKWGKELPAGLKSPFRDGAERAKTYEGFEAGAFFATIKSKFKPGLVDPDVNPILDQQHFYAGCWARCFVVAFAYDVDGNKGVSLSLGHIQKTRDDAPFTKRATAEQAFAPVKPVAGAAAPAASGKDDFLS